MPDQESATTSVLDGLLQEGQSLMEKRPGCHLCSNDMQAATLIWAMHKQGLEVDVRMIEGCIKRMRIAVESGVYPVHLLGEPRTVERR